MHNELRNRYLHVDYPTQSDTSSISKGQNGTLNVTNDKQRREAHDELNQERIPSGEMGTDDAQRRGDGGTCHDGQQADGENGIMEIAALPSCEKSLFAGAKVTLFFGFRGLRVSLQRSLQKFRKKSKFAAREMRATALYGIAHLYLRLRK